MKKRRFISLFHQFYKELKIAKRKGKSIFKPLRFFYQYIKQNSVKRNRMELGIPWMTIPAVNFLDKLIKEDFKIYEYGSGASTIYFLKKGVKIYSAEHSKDWFEILEQYINNSFPGSNPVKLFEPVRSISSEAIYSKKDPKYINFDFTQYVNSINRFDDHFFDIIVIDGRVRIACLRQSINKLKEGGFIIFDNGDRNEYHNELKKIEKFLILSDFTVTSFDLSFNQTNIYQIWK
ncbi:hypothetical protein [Algoriphagus sp.]|uniref:hypothetical protein n=1 Tax=Algoriphagus sp. TaxID=1872435 RepID=UPI00261BBD54|nr:hypothetical protein [Algoriphagus sp.]